MKSKFNLDELVYFMHKNKLKKGNINEISMIKSNARTNEFYNIEVVTSVRQFLDLNVNEIYKTDKEAIESCL